MERCTNKSCPGVIAEVDKCQRACTNDDDPESFVKRCCRSVDARANPDFVNGLSNRPMQETRNLMLRGMKCRCYALMLMNKDFDKREYKVGCDADVVDQTMVTGCSLFHEVIRRIL